MQRIPEPELMNEPAQAEAYALGDFAEAHTAFVRSFQEKFPQPLLDATVLDLGCGAADVTVRLARAYPQVHIHGLDGASAMLVWGRRRLNAEQLEQRVQLVQAYLPHDPPPLPAYDVIISNSLLHHLPEPQVLWQSIKRYSRSGTLVFIMDLCRPSSLAQAAVLVEQYAAAEPEILRRDFFHSLCAAYRPEEVACQLLEAGLEELNIEIISDRHWLAYGRRA